MKSASRQLTDSQRRQVNEAVASAEARTSAEIVPVVATASGRYDRPEDLVGLWLGLASLAVVWAIVPDPPDVPGAWGGTPALAKLAAMIGACLVGFIVGAAVASRVGWLRRLFTPRGQMSDEVRTRAREIFFDHRVHHTSGATGLCVYISLFERMAVLVADEAVMAQLGQEALDELRDRLIADLRAGDVTDALCACLRAAGEKLEAVLPRAGGDVNELPDALVTID